MKKFFLFIFLISATLSFAQPNIKFRLSASSIVDFSFLKVYEFKTSYTSVHSYYPFKTGLNVMFKLPPHLSLSTGYNFLYRFMEINMYTTTVGDLCYGYRMYTSEIPLLLRYDWNSRNEHVGFFTELGTSFDFMYAEKNVFGRYRQIQDFIVVATWGYFYTMNLPKGFTTALQGGFGFVNNLGEGKGIIEFGANYHYQPKQKIANNFVYYYDNGLGNVTKENYNFLTRSSYFAIDFKYYLPFKINLQKDKNKDILAH